MLTESVAGLITHPNYEERLAASKNLADHWGVTLDNIWPSALLVYSQGSSPPQAYPLVYDPNASIPEASDFTGIVALPHGRQDNLMILSHEGAGHNLRLSGKDVESWELSPEYRSKGRLRGLTSSSREERQLFMTSQGITIHDVGHLTNKLTGQAVFLRIAKFESSLFRGNELASLWLAKTIKYKVVTPGKLGITETALEQPVNEKDVYEHFIDALKPHLSSHLQQEASGLEERRDQVLYDSTKEDLNSSVTFLSLFSNTVSAAFLNAKLEIGEQAVYIALNLGLLTQKLRTDKAAMFTTTPLKTDPNGRQTWRAQGGQIDPQTRIKYLNLLTNLLQKLPSKFRQH